MAKKLTKRIVSWATVFFVITLLFCICNAINGCADIEEQKAKVIEYRDGRPRPARLDLPLQVSESLTPRYLRCEYLVNPLGIDVVRPRFSWIVDSGQRGQKQTAYRILVSGSEEKVNADIGDFWDSGKVVSDQTNHIVYIGKQLNSRMRCYWKVKVWDKDGKESQWSDKAYWTMGLLANEDWKAKWIGYDTSSLNEHTELHLPPSPYLRKDFSVSGKIKRATVYVSALGLFELSINGQRVGSDWFTPGWTNYNKRVYYLTYDVTDMLKQGSNSAGAILSNGWYAGYVGFALLTNYPKPRAIYGQVPALLGQLEIEYEDGSREVVVTDENWKVSTGPIRESDILMGETYDGRKEIDGWERSGFNDKRWLSAALFGKAKGVIEAYPSVRVKTTGEIRPVEITEPNKGVYVFNMGQNFAGRVRLKVKGDAGTKIRLRFAEMLHKDGNIMTENLRKARATDTYICRGTGKEKIWEPKFTYHGFQYVEVTGYPGRPSLDAVTGIVLGSDTPAAGYFECSNDMLNKLYSNITWTQRANFFEVPTDCPQRDERMGWTGDAQIYIRSATCNMDVASFFTKWFVDLADDQLASGAYPDYAPRPYRHKRDYSPAWTDAGIICPYTIYKVYGDKRVIENQYESMQKFMDFQTGRSVDFIHTTTDGWGDWLSFGGETPKDLISTVYFAYDAKLMAEMAAAIGKKADVRRYGELFDNIKEAFVKKYVSSEGRIEGDTQTCYALALYMDLLDENLRAEAAKRLVELLKENNWHLATGFLGVKHLLPVLTETGHTDIAYRLLTNTTFPSWGYSVVNGSTTIWERWNSYTIDEGFASPGMNSFSHYAFGSVCQWMFASMAGIDTDGAGFKRIIIRPQPGGSGISYAKASYDSINGLIELGWQIEGDKFTLEVTIPANTTAIVYVPALSEGAVTEGDVQAGRAEGVKFLRIVEGVAVYKVESGNYKFVSRGAQVTK